MASRCLMRAPMGTGSQRRTSRSSMHRATGKLVLLATLRSCRAAVAKAAHESVNARLSAL
jgi:hypothetical protein